MSLSEHVARNRRAWDGWSADFRERGRRAWAAHEPSWGMWGVPEFELGVLPPVEGSDVLELGCGTGYWSARLTRRGANVVGLDNSPKQLESARELQREFGLEFPLFLGNALVNGTILFLCLPELMEDFPARRELQRPLDRLRGREPRRGSGAGGGGSDRGRPRRPEVGAAVALRGDLGRAEGLVSAPPAPPLILASTSPQRRAILEQLGIPFDVVPPRYEEHDPPGAEPAELVRAHAEGKARSVAGDAGERPVLGVDTAVVVDGVTYGKPEREGEAAALLEALSGREHEVVSGLCLLTPGWTAVEHATTRVRFRELTARDVAAYVASGEWRGRAGGYAVQGLGAILVQRIVGDYLNVVGLPAALLVRILAERFPGAYGVG